MTILAPGRGVGVLEIGAVIEFVPARIEKESDPYDAKFHEGSHPISRMVAPTPAWRRPCRESKTVLAAAVPRM